MCFDTPVIEKSTCYKLCDLGQINESGDGKYLAPEILHYEDDDIKMEPEVMAKADIFSLGMTIFELAYERGTNSPLPVKQRSQITPDDINLPLEMYDKDFVQLLRRMMQHDPNLRPSPEDVLLHPLVCSDLASRLEQEQKKSRLPPTSSRRVGTRIIKS